MINLTGPLIDSAGTVHGLHFDYIISLSINKIPCLHKLIKRQEELSYLCLLGFPGD